MSRHSRMLRWLPVLVTTLTMQIYASSGPRGELAAQGKTASAPLVWPGFVVDVTLSEKAKGRLDDGKETLRVFGYYSGSPRVGASRKYISDEGEIGLGSFDVEFPVGSSARIEGVKGARDAFEQTDGKTPMVLVNVVSGRKSSKNNLLECSIFENRLDTIQAGHIPIACKLIAE